MWFVYILLCADKSLYTGITTDPKKRLQNHKAGIGAAYTRSHKPDKIVYLEEFTTRSEALKREVEVKKLKRSEKEELCKPTV